MSNRRGLQLFVSALSCLPLMACGTTGANEGARAPVGGAAGTATSSSAGTAGTAGTAATAAGGGANAGAPAGGTSSSGTAGETVTAGAGSGGASGVAGQTVTAGAGGGGAGGAAGAANTGGTSAGGAGGGPWPFPAGVSKPKLMIVGDSISAGPGCYKKFLLKALTDNHYSSFEFIGEYTDECGGGVRHSAVSCSTAEQYTQATFTVPNCQQGKSFPGMSTLVTTHKPDLLMLQLGVNDVWSSKPTATILSSYTKLIEQARAQNPNVVLVVAQIQKIRPDCSTDETITKQAEELVKAVPAWAAQQSRAGSPVFVADLWTNSDWTKAETTDCVHPNDVGAERMGNNWYAALQGILKHD